MTRQASSQREASFHRLVAKPSGDRMAYTAFSCMSTWLPTARARAPPLLPSPVITATTGTLSRLISRMQRAMASPWPRCSASRPGYAPEVSMRVTTGR